MRYLRRAVERELVSVSVANGEHGTRLDRRSDNTIVDQLERDDAGGRRQCRAHERLIAASPAKADIAGNPRMELRRAVSLRRAHIDNRREHLAVHHDALGAAPRLLAGLADHGGSRLSAMPHAVAR